MQILKRAKGDSGEVVPFNADEKAVKEEVDRRTHKAGYTDRDGRPKTSRVTNYSKGDSRRPGNLKKYRENYVKIYGE